MLLSTQISNVVGRLGFEEGISLLHRVGYDALDLSLFEMVRDDSRYVAGDWRALCRERRAFADKCGIVFNQSHAPFAFKWADARVAEEIAKPRIVDSIEISAIMGVKIAVVHPIHHTPYKGHEDELREINLAYYRSLIPVAREFGVKIAMENMWQIEVKRRCISDDVGSRAAELAGYIDAIDSEWVVACLDVGHSSLVGEEAQDAIRTLGHDRLRALHIHDNDYQGDRHTIPFLGNMDWNAIMAALADIDYQGEFTYEADAFLRHFPLDYLERAAKFMEQGGRYLLSKLPEGK